jgi:hypothetical protein
MIYLALALLLRSYSVQNWVVPKAAPKRLKSPSLLHKIPWNKDLWVSHHAARTTDHNLNLNRHLQPLTLILT